MIAGAARRPAATDLPVRGLVDHPRLLDPQGRPAAVSRPACPGQSASPAGRGSGRLSSPMSTQPTSHWQTSAAWLPVSDSWSLLIRWAARAGPLVPIEAARGRVAANKGPRDGKGAGDESTSR